MPDPNTLNDHCYLQVRAISYDAGGGYNETWIDGSSLWCNVYQTGMAERSYANQVGISAQWTIRTRYDAVTKTIKVDDRIRWGDFILRVTSAQNMQGKNRDIKLLAEEVEPATKNR